MTNSKAPTVAADAFGVLKGDWFRMVAREGRAAATLEKVEWMLSLAGPLDSRPIGEIRAAEVLALLRPIETAGNLETAARLRSTISRIFRFAAAQDLVGHDPTAALKGRDR